MIELVEKWREIIYLLEIKITEKVNPIINIGFEIIPFVDEDNWGFILKVFEEITDEQIEEIEKLGFIYTDDIPCFDCSINYEFYIKDY